MFSVLFNNASLKIAALILGLLLWFHVATEKDYDYEIKLPVKEVLLGEGLTLSRYPPDSVLAVVSASGKQLLRRAWRENGVRINATQFATGKHSLGLSIANTALISGSKQISLDEITAPSQVELYVDRVAEVTLPVEPDLILTPDDGYAVGQVSAPTPSEVSVSGARSLLSGLTAIATEPRELGNLRNNLTLTLALARPDGFGITVKPESATVAIEIVPVKTRQFHDLPVAVFNAPDGHVVKAYPDHVTLTVTGPPNLVDSLRGTAVVVSADFAAADSSGRAAIKVDSPPAIRVKSLSSDSVTLVRQ